MVYPDITKAADVAKLREKKLLKEFSYSYKRKAQTLSYGSNQGGLCKALADKKYKLIVETAERYRKVLSRKMTSCLCIMI